MLVDLKTSENLDKKREVKFVSYSGKYPNLCSGKLHLIVNGKDYYFGYKFNFTDKELKDIKKIYKPFWRSTGTCGFDSHGDSRVIRGEWEINKHYLPDELLSYAAIIDEVFNDNVSHGCCGGCV